MQITTAKFVQNAISLTQASFLSCACFRIASLDVVFPSSAVLHKYASLIDWDCLGGSPLCTADHKTNILEGMYRFPSVFLDLVYHKSVPYASLSIAQCDVSSNKC